MRPLFASLVVAALALPAQSTAQVEDAASQVLRCRMQDGATLYTNRACSTFDAAPMPLPAEMLGRIARQQHYEARLAVNAASGIFTAEDTSPRNHDEQHAPVAARRPVSAGCANTPRQLALDFQSSVAAGDVNRVAESFDWAGMRQAQAHRILTELQRFNGSVVVDADYFSAGDDGFGIAPSVEQGGLMQVVLDSDHGRRVADFDVRIDRGCYFLRFA